MPAGETERHRVLKRLALQWAQTHGFAICAVEVRVPRSGYRADAAAWARGANGRTALFECKQARADLLKDARGEEEAKEHMTEAAARLRKLDGLIAEHRPDLRRGESLFPEFDALDFGALEHRTRERAVAELAKWQARFLRGTKFARLYRWRAADYLYLVAEEDVFAPVEVPAGWGLLVRRDAELQLVRPPVWTEPAADVRAALLESIALAGTRAMNRREGIVLPESLRWTTDETRER